MPNVPGLTYPAHLIESDPTDAALKNLFDNIFYLRGLIQTIPASSSIVTQQQLTKLVTQIINSGSVTINGTQNVNGQVVIDSHSVRINTIPTLGNWFYEYDRNSLYLGSNQIGGGASGVVVWEWAAGEMVDVIANQPTDLSTTDKGFKFYANDTTQKTEYVWDGAAFITVGGVIQKLNDAVTNAVSVVHELVHLTSGTPAAGFGIRLLEQMHNSAGTQVDAASIDVSWTDPANATLTSDFTLMLRNAGAALAKAFRVLTGGALEFIGKITKYNNAAPTDGQLLIGNTAGVTFDAATLTGTAHEITITNAGGSITIKTPQDIDTVSNVQFNQVNIGATNNGGHLYILDNNATGFKIERTSATASAWNPFIDTDGTLKINLTGTGTAFELDLSRTAYVFTSSLKAISEGAADSGGVGFRVLRVAN